MVAALLVRAALRSFLQLPPRVLMMNSSVFFRWLGLSYISFKQEMFLANILSASLPLFNNVVVFRLAFVRSWMVRTSVAELLLEFFVRIFTRLVTIIIFIHILPPSSTLMLTFFFVCIERNYLLSRIPMLSRICSRVRQNRAGTVFRETTAGYFARRCFCIM